MNAYSQSAQAWITQFYPQTTPCLPFLRKRSPDVATTLRQQTSNCSWLLIYQPWRDERLSWPSWLTYSGWFTHISGHPSATGRAQDSKSTPAKDRCSAAGPRNTFGKASPIVRSSCQQLGLSRKTATKYMTNTRKDSVDYILYTESKRHKISRVTSNTAEA